MPSPRSSARWLRHWWERHIGVAKVPRPAKRARRPFALLMESLEDRLVPATTLSISDSSVLEPTTSGTVNLDFTVTRTGDLTSQITVGFTTVAGTAQPGADFTPTTGTTTFASGSATATISIPVFGNGLYENPDLTFSVQLTGVTSAVGPTVTFAPPVTFATGMGPKTVALGDINGDGKPDLVSANAANSTVSVLLNTTAPGAPTPSFATQQTFAAGFISNFVALGDVNGDGKLDLVVANLFGNDVSVLLNTTALGAATPSFAPQQTFAVGGDPFSVALGDVNGDGKIDLLALNNQDFTVSVLLNTTAPGATTSSFTTQQTFAIGNNSFNEALGDINGDGKLDLLVANNQDFTVSVLLNTTAPGAPTASFATQQTFAAGINPHAVALSDVNGDGKLDLLATNEGDGTVSVLLNTTAPGATTASVATQQTFAVGTRPDAIALSDVNGDSKLDLLVANLLDSTVSVLLSTTAPGATVASFAAQQTVAVGTRPYFVTSGDVNGDGQPDLIVPNLENDQTVSVLLNVPATITNGTATGTIIESDVPPNGEVVVNGTAGDDTLLVVRTPGGAVGSITYTLNNNAPVVLTGVTSFTFNGLDGNDTMTASKVNGGPLVSGTVRFDGGTGSNTLVVDANGATTRTAPGVVTFGDPQLVAYVNVAAINIDNAGSVGGFAVPNTADRATALAGLTAQERYVQALYLDDLGRAGSKAELDGWLAALSAPGGALNVAGAIGQSAEAREHLVRSWYAAYLGRAAQGNEAAGFVAALRDGVPEAQVLGQILASPEFYASAQHLIPTGNADERYVRALYQVLLNRDGDSAGVQGFTRVAGAGRGVVALAMLNSTEFRTNQTEGYYNVLLHRPADTQGLNGWVSSNLDPATILVAIQSTPEFMTNG